MLTYLQNTVENKEYLANHGINIDEDGVISGELINLESADPMDAKYGILEAYDSLKDVSFKLACYIFDLDVEEVDTVVAIEIENSLYINEFGVLIVTDYDRDTLDAVVTLAEYSDPNNLLKYRIVKFLRLWPELEIHQTAMISNGLTNVKSMKKVNYEKGDMDFQVQLPLPFHNPNAMIAGSTTGHVLVSVIEEKGGFFYKYSVIISNHPVIYTNKLPRPEDIEPLMKTYNTLWYKTKLLIKGVFDASL